MDEPITFSDEDEDWIKVVHRKNLKRRAKDLGMTVEELEELERNPPKMPEWMSKDPDELLAQVNEKLKELGLKPIEA